MKFQCIFFKFSNMPLVCILKWSVNRAMNTVVYRHENDGEMCDSILTLKCVRLTSGSSVSGNFETVKWPMPLERAINSCKIFIQLTALIDLCCSNNSDVHNFSTLWRL